MFEWLEWQSPPWSCHTRKQENHLYLLLFDRHLITSQLALTSDFSLYTGWEKNHELYEVRP
jgi:hypothetical protein